MQIQIQHGSGMHQRGKYEAFRNVIIECHHSRRSDMTDLWGEMVEHNFIIIASNAPLGLFKCQEWDSHSCGKGDGPEQCD